MDKDFLNSLQLAQEAEQQRAAIKHLATMMRAYYLELREQGFDAIEALTLTSNWQTAVMQQGKGNHP